MSYRYRRSMSSSSSSSSSGGIGFFGLLQILFIGLKLTGHINWSWWWVLSPTWIGFSLALLIFGVVFAILVVAEMKK
jgi:hypothetical protein